MTIPLPSGNRRVLRKNPSATRTKKAAEKPPVAPKAVKRSEAGSRPAKPSPARPAVNTSGLRELLATMDVAELSDLIQSATMRIQELRVETCDTEALIELGFERCFSGTGMSTGPLIEGGVVIVPGSVYTTNKSGNHECHLCTVRLSDGEQWSWAHEDLMIETRTFQDGVVRRTVTLFPAIDGLLIFSHHRKRIKKASDLYPRHQYKAGGANGGARAQVVRLDEDGTAKLMPAPRSESRPLPRPAWADED